jgi:hypothetical protein
MKNKLYIFWSPGDRIIRAQAASTAVELAERMDGHTNEFGARLAKPVQLSSKIMSPDRSWT